MWRLPFCLIVLTIGLFSIHVRANDAAPKRNIGAVVKLLKFVIDADETTASECLAVLRNAVQNGQLSESEIQEIRNQLSKQLNSLLNQPSHPLHRSAVLLTTAWNDEQGVRLAREMFASASLPERDRQEALNALIAAGDVNVLNRVEEVLTEAGHSSVEFRGEVLSALSRSRRGEVSSILLTSFLTFEPQLRPRALEVLTQRPTWSAELLKAIEAKQIDKDALNLNQIARVASFKDEELQMLVAKVYGQVRTVRRGDQQQTINRMRDFLHGTPGDPERGALAFKKVCAQCHKIYGEGAEVGPDITRNGRNDWVQLLNNVFDPSAVIGPGYQARILVTTEGRVLTGLAVEESDQRVVLKIQGGKIEAIPRDQIEEYKVSEVSMMPEQLEKQLTPQEIADLFAFLALDKPPSDPEARILPGAPQH